MLAAIPDDKSANDGTGDIRLVSAAYESLLASIIDVLGGLIGADMVLNLLDPDSVQPPSPQGQEFE